jgi:hypothetical protein
LRQSSNPVGVGVVAFGFTLSPIGLSVVAGALTDRAPWLATGRQRIT